MNVEQSSFSGVVFNVSRWVRTKEIVRGKVFSKSRFKSFNNTFDDFRYKRNIRNGTVVREMVLIKIRFF